MCQSSNLVIKKPAKDNNESPYGLFQNSVRVSVACACMLFGQFANAAGGCGSVCLPLEALDLDKAQVPDNNYRISLVIENADFDNFREGDSSVTNPGGNKAFITQSTLAVDYGISNKWTATVLVPYIRKKQVTNRFGTRVAEGVGDISIFGRYELLDRTHRAEGKSTSIGVGIKFPTGSIDEPNTTTPLPPAFQTGSGAYDIVPTASFYRSFGKGSIFGGLIWRIPLEENKKGYKFGQEVEVNVGADYPFPFLSKNLSFQLSASYLVAGKDDDSNTILPARLRSGSTVLNTGGKFLDIVPGFRWKMSNSFTLQARLSFPIYESWNGNRATNVGQVAPDVTTQLTLIYTGS